eukprot:7954397-Karenia_brevis.AAC.1
MTNGSFCVTGVVFQHRQIRPADRRPQLPILVCSADGFRNLFCVTGVRFRCRRIRPADRRRTWKPMV